MSTDKPDTPDFSFGAGFERDTRALLLAMSEGGITRDEFRLNFKRLGVEMVERNPAALQVKTPSLLRPEPELYKVPEAEGFVFDAVTGWVYDENTLEHVGYIEEPVDNPEPPDSEDPPELLEQEPAEEPEPAEDPETTVTPRRKK